MIREISQLARKAGKEIMLFYNGKRVLNLNTKRDDTPITSADLISHQIIVSGLHRLTPDIPIISEEGSVNFNKSVNYNVFWLIDPLDGTKEFLYHNSEFTVNIALINCGTPVMGVVYVPAINVLYAASNGKAWKEDGYGKRFFINVKKNYPPTVLVSRFHPDKYFLDKYLIKLEQYKIIYVGSSLKFCMIAEGVAQLYPRFSSIKIWDTAAGYAVAVAAGAKIIDWYGNVLIYGPFNSFLNPGFEVSLS
ncbi:3'(2'),5'-bisphosphate nucleotidase CysQ [Blochmannia endosymbiont of Camponotus (Colobopsis) obliquus]|uniref:3'(2'),5'-bisphosphate nucleotidase CysQ n=1 Tax=Blochmannia endosymbiont of Camponotus (Colobopsis) obliquus TaxID=1505597 RepID=UPI00061A83E9|nr:3'(2'),5'-bisphosphate nucleotidase CysQ [Blochmannia endosymbiont of Camponotus (Colobopsis) obliquus]AKC60267.1 3'(2'),5'-bisphosphate nucleotidase CysQ [Blochmannia endosymbiont of Camponotus (Colobopsis) obliquus]